MSQPLNGLYCEISKRNPYYTGRNCFSPGDKSIKNIKIKVELYQQTEFHTIFFQVNIELKFTKIKIYWCSPQTSNPWPDWKLPMTEILSWNWKSVGYEDIHHKSVNLSQQGSVESLIGLILGHVCSPMTYLDMIRNESRHDELTRRN